MKKKLLENTSSIIKAYKCDGNISLDKEYLERLADGKFKAQEVFCFMDKELIDKLVSVNRNTFDFQTYHSFLEDCQIDEAETYFQKNAKCIAYDPYSIVIKSSILELLEGE